MKIIGMDEAGRGPVLGPMILAAVSMEKEEASLLPTMGIKDSKKIRPQKRKALYQILEGIESAEIKYIIFPPSEIDQNSLTNLYRNGVLELCKKLEGKEIYLDLPCPPKGIPAYLEWFQNRLSPSKVYGMNGGEDRYPIVAAASIVAKVIRDQEMEKIREAWGEDLGSGYPSDPKTRRFLNKLIQTEASLPPFVRSKWKTLQRLRQKSLF